MLLSAGMVVLSEGTVSFLTGSVGVTGSFGGFSGVLGTKKFLSSSRLRLPSASVSALVKAESSSVSEMTTP